MWRGDRSWLIGGAVLLLALSIVVLLWKGVRSGEKVMPERFGTGVEPRGLAFYLLGCAIRTTVRCSAGH